MDQNTQEVALRSRPNRSFSADLEEARRQYRAERGIEEPQARPKQETQEEPGLGTRVVRDVTKGVAVEGLPAVARGFNKAINATLDSAHWVGAIPQRALIRAGLLSPDWDPGEQSPIRLSERFVRGQADTFTGGMIEGISQFAAGWIGFGRVMQAAKATGGGITQAMARGAATDMTVFDANEARLSDTLLELSEEHPALRNAVTEYLAHSEDETVAEGKFKLALEGLMAGAVVDTALAGVRGLARLRKAKTPEEKGKIVSEVTDELEQLELGLTGGSGKDLTKDGPVLTEKAQNYRVADNGDVVIGEQLDLPLEGGAMRQASSVPPKDEYIRDEMDKRWGPGTYDAWKDGKGESRQQAAWQKYAATTGETWEKLNAKDQAGELRHRTGTEAEKVFLSGEQVNQIRASLRSIREDGLEGDIGMALSKVDFNFDSWKSDADVKASVNALSFIIRDEMDKLKGGIRTWDETRKLADLIGSKNDAVLAHRLSRIFDATSDLDATLVSTKVLVQSYAERVQMMARQIDAGNATDRQIAQFVGEVHQLANFQAMLKGVQTNTARALNAMKIKTDVDVSKIHPKDLASMMTEAGGYARARKLAHKLAMADNPKAALKMTRPGFWERIMDGYNETFINAILSGPDTHIVNSLSNALRVFSLPTHRFVGGLLTGDRVAMREATQMYMELRRGYLEAAQMAVKAWKAEENILDPGNMKTDYNHKAISAQAWGLEQGPMASFVNGLGQALRVPSRLMIAEDEFFKNIAFRSRIGGLAYREGVRRGLNGQQLAKFINDAVEMPPDQIKALNPEMFDAAVRYAQELTFSNPLEYGVGKWVQDGVSNHTWLRPFFPFVRTPTQIYRAAFQGFPGLGLLQRRHREAIAQWREAAKAGRPIPEEVQLMLGRQATGLGMYTLAYMAVQEGWITGSGHTDKQQRKNMRDLGWQPDSIVIRDPETGDTQYIRMNRLDPYFMPFRIAARVGEMIGDLDDEQADAVIFAAVAALGDLPNETPYLQGFVDLTQRIFSGDPEKVQEWLTKQAVSSVPYSSFMNRVTNRDSYQREAETFLEEMHKRFGFGYSQELPPYRDLLGRPVIKPMGVGLHGVVPFSGTDMEGSVVNKELMRLMRDQDVFFRKPPPTMGHNMELNARDYDAFMEIYNTIQIGGRTLEEALDRVIRSPAYQKAPDGDPDYPESKAERLQRVMNAYRQAAQREFLKQNPEALEAWKIDRYNVFLNKTRGADAVVPLPERFQRK
ncbi:hypothetical protein [Telmatospirillum sp. J64-1]|uniref:hypothetical protein n=1 Tax=Telmatospirillum sp. J64-1 TaxID=2502183 RepID=UPI00115F19BC|nr:hypothetical protein [Telmatospirillum sp. J64-1]